MRARTWLIVITVIILAAVALTVLFLRNRPQDPAIPTPMYPATEETETASSTSPSSPTPPTASPTPPDPLLYTVQQGDTLLAIAQAHGVSTGDLVAANGLADPNVLHVGQILIIPASAPPTLTIEAPPEPSPTEAPPSTPLPTLTPSGPPLIEIGQVLGSGDLAAEVVIVRNGGGVTSLEGWTLSNAEGNTFTFPALTLFTDAQVNVHSAAGSHTPSDLYWGRAEPAWSGGELITLRDTVGNVMDTYIVP